VHLGDSDRELRHNGSPLPTPSFASGVYPERKDKEGSVTFKTRLGRKITFFSKHAGGVTAAMVARFLKFGTRKMRPHAFKTTAWEKSKNAALEHIIARLKETSKLS